MRLETGEATAVVKLNTRLGDLPDIDAMDHPLVTATLAVLSRLRAGTLAPVDFQTEIAVLFDSLNLTELLEPLVAQTLAEKRELVMYRHTAPGVNDAIQLVYIAPNEVHPPHTHHNILSTQVVLHAPLYIREYDVLARLGPDELMLRLASDRWFLPGEAMHTSEIERNAHWFAAGDTPAVLLNFRVYGYQRYTLNDSTAPLRRRLLDPTAGVHPDGYLIGREVELDECYAKFAGKPIQGFPVPVRQAG